MRSKKITDTRELENGDYLNSLFDSYEEMAANAVNWTIFCIYQLKPNSFNGTYRILELPNMQIACTETAGAIMYDYVVPEDCINIAIADQISGTACVDTMKLHTGLIGIFDDLNIHNYMHNGEVRLYDISLKKGAPPLLRDRLIRAMDRCYLDMDRKMARLAETILRKHASDAPLSAKLSAHIEQQATQAMLQMTDEQEALKPRFTDSEKVAFSVYQQIISHMDGHFTTASLAKSHGISERSLQNAFKSLFGFNPNQFIRILKLNLVHHELIQSQPAQTSVSRVAQKWGFTHMGRFANYYSELFGELPSASLQRTRSLPSAFHEDCIRRREEF